MRERWGAFSVRDHRDPTTLICELVLYDRLIIPFPPNDKERDRWRSKHWDPDLLDRRLEALGEQLVERIPWDEELRGQFQRSLETVKEDQGAPALHLDSASACPGATPAAPPPPT